MDGMCIIGVWWCLWCITGVCVCNWSRKKSLMWLVCVSHVCGGNAGVGGIVYHWCVCTTGVKGYH